MQSQQRVQRLYSKDDGLCHAVSSALGIALLIEQLTSRKHTSAKRSAPSAIVPRRPFSIECKARG